MDKVQVTDYPQQLTVQDFRSIADDFGGLAKACRFAAWIKPYGRFMTDRANFARDLMYLCESTELPGRGMINIDLRYYGPNFKLPVQTQYEDINMTFLCRTHSFERQFFDDWMLAINPINTFDFNYRDDYGASIDIYQYSEGGLENDPETPDAQYCITLHNAYPLLINPQPVAWSDDNFQRLVVSFTYTHWSRKGIDPTQRNEGVGDSYSLVAGREVIRNNR